jgi:hypothetical protein
MTALERITERVSRLGDPNDPSTPRPLLTLSEFFDGNDVVGSIGCNLMPTPTPAEFHSLLSAIAARPEVGDVRVQVTMFDNPDEWPFSDTVWVITTADATTVASWFEEALAPDAIDMGWPEGIAYEACTVPAGMRPVSCWWD